MLEKTKKTTETMGYGDEWTFKAISTTRAGHHNCSGFNCLITISCDFITFSSQVLGHSMPCTTSMESFRQTSEYVWQADTVGWRYWEILVMFWCHSGGPLPDFGLPLRCKHASDEGTERPSKRHLIEFFHKSVRRPSWNHEWSHHPQCH